MEKKPTYSAEVDFDGQLFLFEEYFDQDFSQILTKATQSLGVVLNEKEEVLLVSEDKEWWGLPGGTIEKGETPEETLAREIYEETAVDIDKTYIIPFFYMIAWKLSPNGEKTYHTTQLRYITRVNEIHEFMGDPGGNQRFRRFVPLENIDKELSWKGTRDIIKAELRRII